MKDIEMSSKDKGEKLMINTISNDDAMNNVREMGEVIHRMEKHEDEEEYFSDLNTRIQQTIKWFEVIEGDN
jgi:hypothetical protein